jgi:hypothetical protein
MSTGGCGAGATAAGGGAAEDGGGTLAQPAKPKSGANAATKPVHFILLSP